MTASLHGSISDEEKTFVETWENLGDGVHYIIQENRRGDEVQTMITGNRRFRLTTYERILTEEKCLDPRNNPFCNGQFRPIVVPETVSIESNPNALSTQEILRLFKASDVAWDEWMMVLDSPSTLQRMVDLAEESDLSVKRLRQLEKKLNVLQQANRQRVQHSDPAIQAQIDSLNTKEIVTAPSRARVTRSSSAASSSSAS